MASYYMESSVFLWQMVDEQVSDVNTETVVPFLHMYVNLLLYAGWLNIAAVFICIIVFTRGAFTEANS